MKLQVTGVRYRDLPGLEVDKGTQILLAMKYREMAANRLVLPLPEVKFRNFSQSGEDGILHYIFSLIGTIDRRAVEICAGAWFECNSANLIISHGWHALLFEGNEDNVRKGYRLIGTNNIGINAFFLRDDVGADYFPEVSAQSCVKPNVSTFSATAASKLGEYPWQEV